MRNIEDMLERLATIGRLINESRDIADADQEFMLGAKLDDCLLCTQERIASLHAIPDWDGATGPTPRAS